MAWLLLILLSIPSVAYATLDQYGGRTDVSCTNTSALNPKVFQTVKVGNRWWFCDPLGHGLIVEAPANALPTTTNGNNSFDSQHISVGTATAASWVASNSWPGNPNTANTSRGYLSFTFPTPLPNIVQVGTSGLNTSGFTPSGYNVTDGLITSVNRATGVVTVGPSWLMTTPGSASVLGTGTVDLNIAQSAFASSADCERAAMPSVSSATCSGGVATYAFSGALPSQAVPGAFLFTSGFTPSGWNLDDSTNNELLIRTVNTSTHQVTVNMTCPGATSVLGTASIDQNTYPYLIGKYGDTTATWGWDTERRLQAAGFNAIAEDSSGWVSADQGGNNTSWPTSTNPIQLPYFTELKPLEYAMANYLGYLTEPIKDVLRTLNTNYSGWRGAAAPDVFAPGYSTEMTTELQDSVNNGALVNNSSWVLGLFVEDTDWVWGSGAGPDFVSDHTTTNLAYIYVTAPPKITYIPNPPNLSGGPWILSDTKVYSKANATSPSHGTCDTSHPCSLRDWLYDKYSGSISSLNTAWGSTYTSFDSTGTTVTETICASSCTATSYSYTPAHAHIDPYSIEISVGGTAKIGDVPSFTGSFPASISEPGQLESITGGQLSGTNTVNYATPAITLNFASAPNAAITISYTYGGWMGNGTGLMDEAGNSAWLGTSNYCLDNNPNSTSYFVCATPFTGAYFPAPDADAQAGADLDAWIAQYFAEYAKVVRDSMNNANATPITVPFFGLDNTGAWYAPPTKEVLQGQAPYVDGLFPSLDLTAPSAAGQPSPSSSVTAEAAAAYQYLTKYDSDKPFVNIIYPAGVNDSDQACAPVRSGNVIAGWSTQTQRGNEWYYDLNYYLNTQGFNSDYPMIGQAWWSWQDFQNTNQGIVSIDDNKYDGSEAVTASVSCSSPLASVNCGLDNGNYSDAWGGSNGLVTGNALWLSIGGNTACTNIPGTSIPVGSACFTAYPTQGSLNNPHDPCTLAGGCTAGQLNGTSTTTAVLQSALSAGDLYITTPGTYAVNPSGDGLTDGIHVQANRTIVCAPNVAVTFLNKHACSLSSSNDYGVFRLVNSGARVIGCDFQGENTTSGAVDIGNTQGEFLLTVSNNNQTVEGNSFENACGNSAIQVNSDDSGVAPSGGEIAYNTFSHNAYYGISTDASTGVTIEHNDETDGGMGTEFDGCTNSGANVSQHVTIRYNKLATDVGDCYTTGNHTCNSQGFFTAGETPQTCDYSTNVSSCNYITGNGTQVGAILNPQNGWSGGGAPPSYDHSMLGPTSSCSGGAGTCNSGLSLASNQTFCNNAANPTGIGGSNLGLSSW